MFIPHEVGIDSSFGWGSNPCPGVIPLHAASGAPAACGSTTEKIEISNTRNSVRNTIIFSNSG